MPIIITLVIFAAVFLAAAALIRNRKPVSESTQIAAIPEGMVLVNAQELRDVEDALTAIFEIGYLTASHGGEYEVTDDGLIRITMIENDKMVVCEYNPLSDEKPKRVQSLRIPRGRQPQNITSVVEPPPQYEDYGAYGS